ncbi:MAG: hypothetical protein HN341_02515 [Verrucomicrobia bacterium]|jgi:hypothetical protein|nr:hypothetical protein [Verrucomicrobiota bacterium]
MTEYTHSKDGKPRRERACLDGYVYLYQEGDREVFAEYMAEISALSNDDITARLDRESGIGFTGVKRQALYIAVLHKIAQKQGLDSPVSIDEAGRLMEFID